VRETATPSCPGQFGARAGGWKSTEAITVADAVRADSTTAITLSILGHSIQGQQEDLEEGMRIHNTSKTPKFSTK
jgi:hypothetical protein